MALNLGVGIPGSVASDVTLDSITKAVGEMVFPGDGRRMVLHTGVGGYDMFSEEVEFLGTGKRRLYIGRKVIRILRRLKGEIRKSASGRYYKMITPTI